MGCSTNNCNCTGNCNCNSSSPCSTSQQNNLQVSWNNVLYTPSWLTEDNTVKSATITLTSAQILAINSTPIEIIPLPGASNKFIDLVSAYAFIDYGSATYVNSGANRLVLKYNGATDEIMGIPGGFVAETADTGARFSPKDSADNFVSNTSIVATILNANPTTGNSPIKIVVNYRTVIMQ